MEHIAEDRAQESLDGDYTGLSKKQLNGIEAVAMWEPYVQATWVRVHDATEKIVFDRSHVMGHLGKAVDTVRKHEHRALMASDDETLKSKYLWLYSWENVLEQRRDAFATLRHKELKVGRAWAKKRCADSGTTSTRRQAGSSGNGGPSGQCTAGWSRFARWPRRSAGIIIIR